MVTVKLSVNELLQLAESMRPATDANGPKSFASPSTPSTPPVTENLGAVSFGFRGAWTPRTRRGRRLTESAEELDVEVGG